jgi:phage tail sheath protein FI
MTVAYRTPGLYVERLDQDPHQVGLLRTDISGFVGFAERGPLHRAVRVESQVQFDTVFGGPLASAYLGYAVRGFFENGGRLCWVVRVADPLTAQPARVVIRDRLQRFKIGLRATSPGRWGNRIGIETVWEQDDLVRVISRLGDSLPQVLDFSPGTVAPGAQPDGDRQYENLLGVRPDELRTGLENALVEIDPDGEQYGAGFPSGEGGLSGGTDGMSSVRPEHLMGPGPDEQHPWGLSALELVDGVAMVAIPDLMESSPIQPAARPGREPDCSRPSPRPAPTPRPAGVIPRGWDPTREATRPAEFAPGIPAAEVIELQRQLTARCARKGDRIALLDSPPRLTPGALQRHAGELLRSGFAALYYPWIWVNDPLQLTNVVRAIPPSGSVAGMIARSDRLRGVHKPPANEELNGVYDLVETVDHTTHGDLNEAGINAIRAIPGRGILVLGARTLDRDFRFRFVNVRRLMSMIEESIDEAMQWTVFEPNNPRLWREIDRSIRAFLEDLFRRGMLDGATSEDAYTVKCDADTNPPSSTGEGKVTCLVGVQPPFPAEFVVVRIGVTQNGIQVIQEEAH